MSPASSRQQCDKGVGWAGRLQGHALVQFESVEAAERAAEMDGQDMMGRPQFVRLSEAPQKDREPPPQCWFCLSSDAADTNLVISIGQSVSAVQVGKDGLDPAWHVHLCLSEDHAIPSFSFSTLTGRDGPDPAWHMDMGLSGFHAVPCLLSEIACPS